MTSLDIDVARRPHIGMADELTITVSKGSLSSTAVVTTPTWDLAPGNDTASVTTRIGGGKGG